jgi:hypothetical protein
LNYASKQPAELRFNQAEKEYLNYYPWYEPGNGMRMFAAENWDNYGG